MNRKTIQKLLALILSMIMVLGMMPLTAIAETMTAQEDAAITAPDGEGEAIEAAENKTEEIVVEEPVEETVLADTAEEIVEDEPVEETVPQDTVEELVEEELEEEEPEEEELEEEEPEEEEPEEEKSEEEAVVAEPEDQPVSMIDALFDASIAAMNAIARAAGWDPDNGSFEIGSVADLVDFQNRVNNQGNTFANAVIKLINDLDLGSILDWTPIGNGRDSGTGVAGASFAGTFNGQGHTISNLSISGVTWYYGAGLFGAVDGGTVQNLILENVDIDVSSNRTGAAIGILTGGGTAENITVSSGSVVTSGTESLGGVVGNIWDEGTVKGCTNNADVSSAFYGSVSAGGIVGDAFEVGEGKTITIVDCTNNGKVTSTTGIGGIVGTSAAEVSGCTNNAELVNHTGRNAWYVGGIVGLQSGSYIKDCTNNGNVGTANVEMSGGIVGWVDDHHGPRGQHGPIEISGNTNTGDVIGGNYVGGIAGQIQSPAIVTDNGVSSSIINGEYETAGVVGQYVANRPGSTLILTGNDVATDIANITSTSGTATNFVNIDANNPPASGSEIQTTNPPHSFGSWTTTVQPQVGVAGIRERECTTCGLKETEAVPALSDSDPNAGVIVTLPYVINALWVHDGMPEADDAGINHVYAPAISWGIANGLLTENQVDKLTTYGDLRAVLTAYAALHGMEDMVIELPGADNEKIADDGTLNRILAQFYKDLEEALAAKA